MKRIFTTFCFAVTVLGTVFAQEKRSLYRSPESGDKVKASFNAKKSNNPTSTGNNSVSAACAGTPLLTEDFSSGMPSGYTIIDQDGESPNHSFMTDAWIVADDGTGNNVAMSTSWYVPAGTSDDWMITTQVVLGSNSCLSWRAMAYEAAYPDGYVVYLSTTDSQTSSFTNTLQTVAAEAPAWTEYTIDLSAYAGQSVYIAFVNNSNDMNLLYVDDIKITNPAATDVAVTSMLAPIETGCLLTATEQVTANIDNVGSSDLTDVVLTYTVNGTLIDTDTIASLTAGTDIDHTFSTTYDMSSAGDYIIVINADVTGDADNSNNTVTDTISSLAPGTAPYSMGFEDTEDYSFWTVLDEDGDGVEFTPVTSNVPAGAVCMRRAGTGGASDDWLITTCIDLQASKTYRVSYIHRNFQTSAPNQLEVSIGTSADPASQTTLIASSYTCDEENINVNASHNFNVSADGVYYIGFRVNNTAGASSIRLDEIKVTEVDAIDAGTSNITAPVENGCSLSATEEVTIEVMNAGLNVIDTVYVSYEVDGVLTGTDTVYNIAAGATVTHTFSTLADLSAQGADYVITAYTTLAGDVTTDNDTTTITVRSLNRNTAPYSIGFEDGEPVNDWAVIDNNGDGSSWSIATTGGGTLANNGDGIAFYAYNATNAADDYLISPCFDLEAGRFYTLSFAYRARRASFPEKMKVLLGNGLDVANYTRTLRDRPNITDTVYNNTAVNFTVPTTGTYNFAFQCYSNPNMWLLLLDDVDLQVAPVSAKITDLATVLEVYPNPAKDVLNINLPENTSAKVNIINTLGQLVYTSDITGNNVIDTSKLTEGNYVVKIQTNDEVLTQKVSIIK